MKGEIKRENLITDLLPHGTLDLSFSFPFGLLMSSFKSYWNPWGLREDNRRWARRDGASIFIFSPTLSDLRRKF